MNRAGVRWGLALACLLGAACLCGLPGGAVARAAVPAWTTYHHDSLRTGFDPDSTSPVSSVTQAWQTSPALDGQVFGSPLVYGSRVYVATENDTVYALDAASGAVIWSRHVATPVPENSSVTGCGNVNPVGITGTPVIDPATGRIFVVAETWDGASPASIRHLLVGLNLSDGTLTAGLPKPIDPPGSTPRYYLQRPGLALDAGKVIVGLGGNSGDCGDYHGTVIAAAQDGSSVQTYTVASGDGAVWGSGNGLPVDGSGFVWASTGNGTSSTFAFQETILKLRSDMTLADHWTPSNWASLDSGDTDLGSSEPLLLPGGLVFQIGKQGVGYLLSSSALGGTGAAPVFQASVCGGSWGGGIYVSGVIYLTCNDGLHALAVNLSTRSFSALGSWKVAAGAVGPPIMAGGLVWSAGWGNGTLYGLDPGTGAVRFSANLGSFNHFQSPSAAGGRLFVANGNRVSAFTIANPPAPTATATSLTASTVSVAPGGAVTFTATVAPAPDGGTVSFADGGGTLAGCAAVPVAAGTGRAVCTASFVAAGSQTVVAQYSGDAYYGGSRSAGVTETVAGAGPAPRLSLTRPRLSVRGRTVKLTLTLSEPASLTVQISRLVPGRRVGGRCRAGARRGRRCTLTRRRVTLHRRGRRGADRFTLRLRSWPAGRYVLSVSARDAGGTRTRPRTLRFRLR